MTESTVTSGRQVLPLIDYLARVGRRAVDTRLSGFPGCLRPRHLVALRLLHEHGPLPQHGLGAALSLDPSNVVGLLNELEERGLITRRRDPEDRRRHIVSLSPAGESELTATDNQASLAEDDLLKALTAEERGVLYELLVRAAGGVSPTWGASKCAADSPCAAEEPPGEPPACPR